MLTFQESKEQRKFNPVNVGIILSGGQAPGGHNLISGLYDGIKKLNSDSKLYGFLGGPSGLLHNQYRELTDDLINEHRNAGKSYSGQYDNEIADFRLKPENPAINAGHETNFAPMDILHQSRPVGARPDIGAMGNQNNLEGEVFVQIF